MVNALSRGLDEAGTFPVRLLDEPHGNLLSSVAYYQLSGAFTRELLLP